MITHVRQALPFRRVPMQPPTIDPTLDLCTRYPLQLGGMDSLPDTSAYLYMTNTRNRTHDQSWDNFNNLIVNMYKLTIRPT